MPRDRPIPQTARTVLQVVSPEAKQKPLGPGLQLRIRCAHEDDEIVFRGNPGRVLECPARLPHPGGLDCGSIGVEQIAFPAGPAYRLHAQLRRLGKRKALSQKNDAVVSGLKVAGAGAARYKVHLG